MPLSYVRKKGWTLWGRWGLTYLSLKDKFEFLTSSVMPLVRKASRECSFGVCSGKQSCNTELLLSVLLLLDPLRHTGVALIPLLI